MLFTSGVKVVRSARVGLGGAHLAAARLELVPERVRELHAVRHRRVQDREAPHPALAHGEADERLGLLARGEHVLEHERAGLRVMPSCFESERNGICSSSAAAAAGSASAFVTPPTTAIAPSSSASASIAAAVPAGSPRVSRTATLTPEPSSARPTPCRIASPQRL